MNWLTAEVETPGVFSRFLQLGAEPSGKAINDRSLATDTLSIKYRSDPHDPCLVCPTPFSIVIVLARDADAAEGTIAKNAAFICLVKMVLH